MLVVVLFLFCFYLLLFIFSFIAQILTIYFTTFWIQSNMKKNIQRKTCLTVKKTFYDFYGCCAKTVNYFEPHSIALFLDLFRNCGRNNESLTPNWCWRLYENEYTQKINKKNAKRSFSKFLTKQLIVYFAWKLQNFKLAILYIYYVCVCIKFSRNEFLCSKNQVNGKHYS